MNEPEDTPRSRLYGILKREVREGGLLDPTDEDERIPASDPRSRMMAKLETFFWMGLAVAVVYYTDIFRTAFTDPAVNFYWVLGGLVLVGINAVIGIYLIFVVGYWKQVGVNEWENRVPWAIPVATASGVLSAISLTVGLWPVWGVLTPLLVFVIMMGGMFLISAIPFKAPRSKDAKGEKSD